MQLIDKKEKNSFCGLTDRFSGAMILDHLRRKEGGATLLRFADEHGISMMFDDTLPEKVPAMTFIRESRLPQNLEKGTVIFLNPRLEAAVLATALMEKLHFCSLAKTSPAPQTAHPKL